jgi:hypothetical protein
MMWKSQLIFLKSCADSGCSTTFNLFYIQSTCYTMAKADRVICDCYHFNGALVTHKHAQAHHTLAHPPYLVPPAPSRVHPIVTIDSDDESDISDNSATSPAPSVGTAGPSNCATRPASAMSIDPSVDHDENIPHLEI